MDITQMTPAMLENQLAQLTHALSTARDVLSEAHDVFMSIDEWKNEFFAKLLSEAPGDSNAAKERHVYVSPEWHKFKNGLVKSKRDFQKAKYTREKLETRWETCRSIMSDRRAERRTAT